ncbi:helix-turn-helix domain-containing protein [Aequorivita antarctica]|uniref:Helix-turn-helix transcriptional regulator n=1 Tax=Aequorivita antarctica TaxID=153266 RepID=A0A5C6Z1B9_9FLAO|nr:helix-turn-helix transcriptional regulator [Aequorivita antarctica]TXD73817.1 helix-turn-helix transcriptional regulator [Aequorivita antarctica]SRX73470.1 Transcriptional regulatory protein LiaR [Aequorivita antarctica]
MDFKKIIALLVFFFAVTASKAQYQFSGYVDAESAKGAVYLSVVDDYRKISGVFPEQILNKTYPDSTGYFSFSGDNLPAENKIYRIHVDMCNENDQNTAHFTGQCPNSKEVNFIANNNDTLTLPFSFDNEMFCLVISKNEKANAFLKIDSLKHDMRFAFGTYRSEANRKINSKKWFSILQQYGEQLHEPLAELYSYSFFSDRAQPLHAYYLEDLKTNSYYDNLLNRLKEKYPNSNYTEQYREELASDKYLIATIKPDGLSWWVYGLGAIAALSIFGNFFFYGKLRKMKSFFPPNKESLSNQEKKVLELILENKSNKEIASDMFVSLSTVKTHINNLYKKLNVSSREDVKNLYSS